MASNSDLTFSQEPADPASTSAPAPAPAITPYDRDLMIRTVIGEAGNDPSATGVANVIANRAKATGQPPSKVVLAPNQFEPWSTRSRELLSYAPDSPAYKRAAAIVDGVISGKTPDPTGGATMFYAPKAQAALGRPAPAWDDGTGVQIGAHKFFGGTPVAQNGSDDVLRDFEIAAPPPRAAGAPAASGKAAPGTGAGAPDTGQIVPDITVHAKNARSATPPVQPAEPDVLRDFEIATPPGAPNPIDQINARAAAIGVPPTASMDEKAQAVRSYGEGSQAARQSALSPVLAATGNFLGGVPIVGAPLESGVQKGSALISSALNGTPYSNALNFNRGAQNAADVAHPGIATGSAIAGGVAGTIPAMEAAPAAFGLGQGSTALRATLSGLTGAAIGGADAGVRTGGDPNAMGVGAGLGGLFGAAAPMAARAVGSGIGAISNAFSRAPAAARNVLDILHEIGMTPTDARNALARIGPNATLADIDPALTTEAGGLASLGGKPTSILKNAMAARAAQADNRVATAVDQHLGPKPDLTATKEAIVSQGQAAAAPHYRAASTAPMDVTSVLSSIDNQLQVAAKGGGEAAVLNKAKGFLSDQKMGMTSPRDNPAQLLKARQEMDGMIESLERNGTIDGTSAGKNAYRAAVDIRNQLDAVLKQDPAIAAGDAVFAAHMRVKDALMAGTELFTKGVRLEDFRRSLTTMSPAEIDAFRQGARVAIGDALELARRGELSGAQSMFAKASANRAKLDALFPNAGDVFDMLHGEAAMRGTEQRVAQNSATAERQAVHRKYSPTEGPGMSAAVPLIGEAVGGGPGAVAAATARFLYGHAKNALSTAALDKLIEGTSRGLAATGQEQQDFFAQLARAHRAAITTNALSPSASAAANALVRNGNNALLDYYSRR